MILTSQEAQLSHRGSATLSVIEYFAKSLNVIWNETIEYGICKSQLVFHCNCLHLYCFWDSQCKMMTKYALRAIHGHWKWYQGYKQDFIAKTQHEFKIYSIQLQMRPRGQK